MLEAQNVRVAYGPIVAVDGIDLSISSGECVGLLGANGAGKSSTLRALSGLVASDGLVTLDGAVIGRSSPDAIARAGLIHVPEGRHVVPTLTVEENLLVGESARGGRSVTFSLDDVFDLFAPLAPLRRRLGWMLSGGEQQMVAVGRALVASPRLLMLDEPSLGLAPIIVRSMFTALSDIVATTPVLLVEQNTVMALDICHRAYVMNGGRIVMDGSAETLRNRRDLVDSILGTDMKDHGERYATIAARQGPELST